jgi:hypothetical protein
MIALFVSISPSYWASTNPLTRLFYPRVFPRLRRKSHIYRHQAKVLLVWQLQLQLYSRPYTRMNKRVI